MNTRHNTEQEGLRLSTAVLGMARLTWKWVTATIILSFPDTATQTIVTGMHWQGKLKQHHNLGNQLKSEDTNTPDASTCIHYHTFQQASLVSCIIRALWVLLFHATVADYNTYILQKFKSKVYILWYYK